VPAFADDRVDILIGDVDAAGEGDHAVRDAQLAVVAVVLMRGKDGRHRREHLAADARGADDLIEAGRRLGQTADRVVHQPHVHPLRSLFLQKPEKRVPHLALL